MRVEAGHLQVSYLEQQIQNGQIIVPSYQREYCWTDEQKLLFVDSVLNDIPVGVLQLRKSFEDFKSIYEVVDGLHRIRTLFMVLKGNGFYYNIEKETFTLDPSDFDYAPQVKDSAIGLLIPNDTKPWNKSIAFSDKYKKFTHIQLLHFTYQGTDVEVKAAFERINQSGVAFTPIFNQVKNTSILEI